MRPIDADALKRAMYHEAFEKDTDLQKWDSGCWIRYKMFENKIEEAPTIDAIEQKHGHWIFNGKDCNCSNCKFGIEYGDKEMFKYYYRQCPYCGTIMDEEI